MVLFLLERLVNIMTTQERMGMRIKQLREEKQLSQSELANLVGYKDKTSIAKIEAGKVDLPQSKITAFVKSLNTTTSYLFGDDIDSTPNTIAAHFDGDEYTEDELKRIKEFAAFVKIKQKVICPFYWTLNFIFYSKKHKGDELLDRIRKVT